MILFHGVSSDDVRVIVEEYPDRPVPKRKIERFSIPGRSGDIVTNEDAWENVTQSYSIYVSAEGPGLSIIADKAVQWLMVPGYHILEDEYDYNTFRLASFLGPNNLANTLNMFGRAKIEFDCWPQRFLKSGARPLRMAQNTILVNPSIYTAEPLIVVHGAGTGVLSVGDYQVVISDCDEITLDCRDEDAYRDVSNLNTAVEGEFPKLPAGNSQVSWSGGITAVDITPRWFVL